jgi:hypothetical protein
MALDTPKIRLWYTLFLVNTIVHKRIGVELCLLHSLPGQVSIELSSSVINVG